MKTVKMKTAELESAQLDWAVAKALDLKPIQGQPEGFFFWGDGHSGRFTPSTEWYQGGPILARMLESGEWGIEPFSGEICVSNMNSECLPHNGSWSQESISGFGSTTLIAAMRAFVASKLGDEVEVPA